MAGSSSARAPSAIRSRWLCPSGCVVSFWGRSNGRFLKIEFDQNKLQLAQNLTDQLAVNLENARLFQESQRATQRERLVNEISSRLTSQNNIDHILQTAVREVGMALRAPQVSVRLNEGTKPNGHEVYSLAEDSESRSKS